ncbi:hypothetical protein FA13DRAFT_1740385 [Coprinellus micaceus]|uniref:Uncharacterized protein n=1 Tax=Coprinellus micaceus TaxID=71717 RepID=A0A4Y7SMI2_COPMI|nr:hypothetical protein FA13DRAFT_1740385 [Coprinellus micaceus]
MASKAPQDNEPTGHHSEFFAGAQNTTTRDMTTNAYNGQTIFSHDASIYRDNAVRNQATHGAHLTVHMPSPSAQPVSPQSHSRSSSSTRSSPRATPDRYPAPSYYEAPRGANTLGAVPQNPYGSRQPEYHQQESSPPTPQGSESIDGGRGPGGLLALARDDPLHPQPDYGLTPPQLPSPSFESLSGFGTSPLLREPSSLGGSDELSPDDSRSVALRPPEETEVDRRSVSTPPAPQEARSEVEERVRPPAPAAPQTAENVDEQLPAPAASAHDGLHAEGAGSAREDGGDVKAEQEEPKDALEGERSTPLFQRTPASGHLSLESPSRVHFNSAPSFDDQSSVSDEGEANAAPAAPPEGAQQAKLGSGKRFRFWLSRKLEGLARRVAPTGV